MKWIPQIREMRSPKRVARFPLVSCLEEGASLDVSGTVEGNRPEFSYDLVRLLEDTASSEEYECANEMAESIRAVMLNLPRVEVPLIVTYEDIGNCRFESEFCVKFDPRERTVRTSFKVRRVLIKNSTG